MRPIFALFGRVLLSLIFIVSGLSKIGSYQATVAMIESHGVPAAPFCLYAAVLIEICGGLMVLTGFRGRLGALLLILFLIPTTFIFHFKPAFDAQMHLIDRSQMIQFLKNLSIMGGLFMAYGNGIGKWTIGKDA